MSTPANVVAAVEWTLSIDPGCDHGQRRCDECTAQTVAKLAWQASLLAVGDMLTKRRDESLPTKGVAVSSAFGMAACEVLIEARDIT